jgi:predicted transcriptional regulator
MTDEPAVREVTRRAVEAALRHPKSATLSDRQIAEHVGVSHPMVSKFRASGNGYQMSPVREVTRNGTSSTTR